MSKLVNDASELVKQSVVEQASEASVLKQSAAEQMSRVRGASK